MGSSVPLFYPTVVDYITRILLILSLIVQGAALVHALVQRGEGFVAIGTLPKGVWVAILAVSVVLTLLLQDPIGIFSLIGVAAAAIYLLDVRAGLRDLSDGKGNSW